MIFNDVFGESESFVMFGLLFFTSMIILFTRWLFRQIIFILRLKKEKKQAELMHLKSQVNPHFFFNTLNNLYGLIEEDKGKAQELVLKLSDMMRYSIYEGQKDLVSLQEEIAYLQGYIQLHEMRYHKTIAIQFNINVENDQIQIMPLLFIILLENAFKHGVENLRKDAYVTINLKGTNSEISFEIENNFDAEELAKTPGIGLTNLKRRLELSYPKQYNLQTSIVENVYKAVLNLSI